MKTFARFFPLLILALAVGYVASKLRAPAAKANEMQLSEFGKLPVLHKGRVKPYDTLARTSLMMISRFQDYKDADGVKQPAIRWLLDVFTAKLRKEVASRKVKGFRIDNESVLSFLSLPSQPGHLYSFEDFGGQLDHILAEAKRIRNKEERELTAAELAFAEFVDQAFMYLQIARYETSNRVFSIDNDQLLNLLGLPKRPGDYHYGLDEFAPRVPLVQSVVAKARNRGDLEKSLFEHKAMELYQRIQLYLGLARFDLDTLRMTAPAGDETQWRLFGEGITHDLKESAPVTSTDMLLEIFGAYALKDVEKFNTEVVNLRDRLKRNLPESLETANSEVFFNHVAPFYQSMVLYIWVAFLGFLSWALMVVGWHIPVNRAAFWLGILTLTLHTLALTARMYIQGRPPVTNLYSAAVFIGWGAVGLALILEGVFQNSVGSVVASILGSLSLLLAHHLEESGGDTMEMMQAVLDTNFWLSTHVTIVTFGYVATLVAGLVGALFIVLGVCTPMVDQAMTRAMTQMIYGVTCFACFLSFTGTVLGGIWADYSWGRFWGWDPKENGALLVVLANALLLHGRWAGILKPRGMAIIAVFGAMVVAWSYLGTNQLGIGLHAYGFNDKLNQYLVGFWGVHSVFLVMGLMPMEWWWSFRAQASEALRRAPRAARKGTPSLAVES